MYYRETDDRCGVSADKDGRLLTDAGLHRQTLSVTISVYLSIVCATSVKQ